MSLSAHGMEECLSVFRAPARNRKGKWKTLTHQWRRPSPKSDDTRKLRTYHRIETSSSTKMATRSKAQAGEVLVAWVFSREDASVAPRNSPAAESPRVAKLLLTQAHLLPARRADEPFGSRSAQLADSIYRISLRIRVVSTIAIFWTSRQSNSRNLEQAHLFLHRKLRSYLTQKASGEPSWKRLSRTNKTASILETFINRFPIKPPRPSR